jgi:uroporphyrinogen decarboxylase
MLSPEFYFCPMQNTLFVDTLKGRHCSRPPVWFMRQAGRILPGYLKLREKYSFKELMEVPELCAEVTIMPLKDLGVDAAILFSDILVVPQAMGMSVDFTDSGPVFDSPLFKASGRMASKLAPDGAKLDYIYSNIKTIKQALGQQAPLVGFCGSPLTTLCYMVQGRSTNHAFPQAIDFIYSDEQQAAELIDLIADFSIEYAMGQIKAGVDAFQLFETHAGLLPLQIYRRLVLPAVKKIGAAVKSTGTPFIYFAKGLGAGLADFADGSADFVSIDWQMPLEEAKKLVGPNVGLQGNIDPRQVNAPAAQLLKYLETHLLPFGRANQDWICNLGHGFTPDISYKHAKQIVDWVKTADWQRG